MSVAALNAALGIELLPKGQNPYWQFYECQQIGSYSQVRLNLSKDLSRWSVTWGYDVTKAPYETSLDLGGYGPMIDLRIQPNVPPEGTKSLVYRHQNNEISFEFSAKSGQLRAISVSHP
jgi:hypothetical protein